MLVSVRIQILYFGVLKDIFARDRETLDLTEGESVEDVIRLLQTRASNPQNAMWSSLAVAVNREYAPTSTLLRDADELALLPPVSGGSQACGRAV
jgi:molybdopterin converting factor subunit 1